MLSIESLSLRLDTFELRDVSLEVRPGEFFIILGPTGAGKTLLLESIAGIHRPACGRIVLEGREITGLAPRDRAIGMVYQDYVLFPHLTVEENIAFGLKQRRVPADQRHAAVLEVSSLLEITHLLARYPETLSGGERQRTALARALVLKPAVLLLDEPLSALDSRTREQIRRELLEINRTSGTTIILITHHFDDVYLLADRIAVMQGGRIIQTGLPSEVFLHPANTFVAEFLCIGNLIRGISSRSGSLARIRTNGCEFSAASSVTGPVVATLHAEDIILSRERLTSSARNSLPATVTRIVPVGSTVRVILDAGFPLTALLTRESCREMDLAVGSMVYATFKATAVHVISETPAERDVRS